ncbi:uncharacterized protein LOC105710196 [Aotus nancymaae]|uniref:uncharacterized protein LOC105710196 n=1 Tax=Aotus nancymaae TaxID=37293 RepID=UPI0030FE64A1
MALQGWFLDQRNQHHHPKPTESETLEGASNESPCGEAVTLSWHVRLSCSRSPAREKRPRPGAGPFPLLAACGPWLGAPAPRCRGARPLRPVASLSAASTDCRFRVLVVASASPPSDFLRLLFTVTRRPLCALDRTRLSRINIQASGQRLHQPSNKKDHTLLGKRQRCFIWMEPARKPIIQPFAIKQPLMNETK